MILREFPDLGWLREKATQSFLKPVEKTTDSFSKGWPDVILNVKTTGCYRDNIRGPLSIFTNLSGESSVEVEGKRSIIRQGFYFVSNRGQNYTLEVAQDQPAETFNIHFGAGFLEELKQSLLQKPEVLLEDSGEQHSSVCFHNRLTVRDDRVNRIIARIRSTDDSALSLRERLAELAMILMDDHAELTDRMHLIPTVKSSTRIEIIRRLVCSIDFMYAHFNSDITLEEVAAASCLSKFHFLRLFRITFGKTPGMFLNEIRIDRAKEALRTRPIAVHALAAELGYRNSSSFSRMFRNHTGVYPGQFRLHTTG